jgi:hypothetical protein
MPSGGVAQSAMPKGATSLKELELSRGFRHARVSLVEGTQFYVDFVMDIVVAWWTVCATL